MNVRRPGAGRLPRLLRRIARISSLLSIGFLFLIVAGEILFPHAAGPFTNREILPMLFFPIGVVAGMVLAWRTELAGGLLTIASLLAFYLTLFAFDGRFPRGPYFSLS